MSESRRIASPEMPGAYRVVGVCEDYRTIEMGNLTGTARIVPEEVCEFVLRLGSPGEAEPSAEISAADCRFIREDSDESHAVLHFECADRGLSVAAHFSAGPGPRLRKWLSVRNTGANPCVLFDAVVEQFALAQDANAWGGGRGWPVFVGGLGYFAIEHPEAENRLADGKCILEYCPAVTLEAGDTYETECALLEFAPDDPEAALRAYTDEFRLRRSDNLFAYYSTWGAHEYEGPNERTARTQVENIIDLRSQWNVPLEYFVLDHGYWSDGEDPCRTGRYTIDTEIRFPGNSFDELIASLSSAGIGLGMWFGVADVEDKFVLDLVESITGLRSRYNLRLIKADASGAEIPKYSRYHAARMLIDAFARIKVTYPDMLIHATGFSRSPWWLKCVDYMSPEEPGLSDIPAPTLRDSQIISTDLGHRFFELDAGVNIGYSDAAFWAGKQSWRKGIIMSMSRSNQLHLSGDLGILDENDRQFLQHTIMHHSSCREVFGHARPVMGQPGSGQVYGYANVRDDRGMVVLYNPSWVACKVELRAVDIGCSPEVRNLVIELFPSTQACSMPEWESCELRFQPWEVKLLEVTPSEQYYEFFESRLKPAGKYAMPITPITPPEEILEPVFLHLERSFYRTGSAFRCEHFVPREWAGFPVMVDLRDLRGELYINNEPPGAFGGSFAVLYPGTREYGLLRFGESNLFYVAAQDPKITAQPDLVIQPLAYSSSSTCREDWPHANVSSMVIIVRLLEGHKPVRPATDPRMAQCAIWLDGIWMDPYRVPPPVPHIRSGYSWAVFGLDLEGDWECARVMVPHLLDVDYEIEFFLTDRIPAFSPDQRMGNGY